MIIIKSLKNSNEFVNIASDIIFSFYKQNKGGYCLDGYHGPSIESFVTFTIQPEITYIKLLNIGNIFTNFAKLRCDIDNLTRVQYLIEPYDSELFELLSEEYEYLLNLLYEAFTKEYSIELTKDMTYQEIKNVIYSTLNYDRIIETMTFMSSNLRKRTNELKKQLAVQSLTN